MFFLVVVRTVDSSQALCLSVQTDYPGSKPAFSEASSARSPPLTGSFFHVLATLFSSSLSSPGIFCFLYFLFSLFLSMVSLAKPGTSPLSWSLQ